MKLRGDGNNSSHSTSKSGNSGVSASEYANLTRCLSHFSPTIIQHYVKIDSIRDQHLFYSRNQHIIHNVNSIPRIETNLYPYQSNFYPTEY